MAKTNLETILAQSGAVIRILAVVILVFVTYSIYRGFASAMATYRYRQAREQLAAQQIPGALAQLERARSWDSSHVGTSWLLARHALAEGDRENGGRLLRELYQEGERNPGVLDALARLHEEAGEVEAARELYGEM
ncbi:MAG: hypothetical protein V3T77_05700, partial [Planctomycetota bacterium]